MFCRGGAVLAIAWTLTASLVAAADSPALLYGVAGVRKASPASVELSVTDRFATRSLTVATPSAACWAESPSTDVLAGYAVRATPRRARRLGATVTVVTRFGTEQLAAKTFAGVIVPSSLAPPSPTGAPRACYAVRAAGGRHARLSISDATGE